MTKSAGNLRIWSYLLKKSLMENFIFRAIKRFLSSQEHARTHVLLLLWVAYEKLPNFVSSWDTHVKDAAHSIIAPYVSHIVK